MNLVSFCLSNWFEEIKLNFECCLNEKMACLAGPSESLDQALRYALLDGGKRLRAMLVFCAGHAAGTCAEQLTDAACAIEAMHAYSLVHDDLPCMDDDLLRRGKPTCHVQFGEAVALLAGDALQTLAFQWLAQSEQASPKIRLQQIVTLAKAAGSQGMAAGQAIDLAYVGKSMDLHALEHMHARKTGDLIKASVRLGYLSNPDLEEEQRSGLEMCAEKLGLAYQVMDDILDVESNTTVLGKTSGKDALNNKPTMVSLMGLQEAKILLEQLREQALGACWALGQNEGAPLKTLIERITRRTS